MCIALISKSLFSSLWGWGTCSSKSSCPSKRTWNEALLWLVDTGANEEREPISFEKRDLYQVIDSPTDLLVWGLDRGSHAGTQPLFFCQGKKKSGGHLCMYLLPFLLLLQKKPNHLKREVIRGCNYRLMCAKQQLLLLLCLVSAFWCSCLKVCTCALFSDLLCLSRLI